MHTTRTLTTAGAVLATIAVASFACSSEAGAKRNHSEFTVELCDGETTLAVAAGPKTTDEGHAIASSLMSQWVTKNPNKAGQWQMGDAPATKTAAPQDPDQTPDSIITRRHTIEPPFDNSYLLGEGQSKGHAYGGFTKRDIMLWAAESKNLVVDGARIFHNAGLLGSTIAVSCDMCHPDASNTHPETYPKFQTQLGEVALLRDMINWCIQHPVRGEKLAADDPKMRALEAYIYGQRRGTELNYGKH